MCRNDNRLLPCTYPDLLANFTWVFFKQLGEIIDIGTNQSSISLFSGMISLIALGIYALHQSTIENDDDDSDNNGGGGGGLMNPII